MTEYQHVSVTWNGFHVILAVIVSALGQYSSLEMMRSRTGRQGAHNWKYLFLASLASGSCALWASVRAGCTTERMLIVNACRVRVLSNHVEPVQNVTSPFAQDVLFAWSATFWTRSTTDVLLDVPLRYNLLMLTAGVLTTSASQMVAFIIAADRDGSYQILAVCLGSIVAGTPSFCIIKFWLLCLLCMIGVRCMSVMT